jgi:ribosomal protein S18 acetylase RimI-like enzyme
MREVRDFIPEDAAALAQCINESEGGWPGGITGGVQHTAEHVLDDYSKQSKITWLIAITPEGKVAGISTLHPHWEDPEAGYLGFLNVSDKYRKQGYGKALLLESIRRTMQEGYKRLFLGTWEGNLNAVPVYKRTGFFWRPDTRVWMDNYIPTILTLPIAKPFFEKHPDWYRIFQREINQVPDKMEFRGLHVYEYQFAANGDILRVLIDRESRGVTLIETNDVLVQCVVFTPEPALGLPVPVEWIIQNKRQDRIIEVNLKLETPKGFTFIERPPQAVKIRPGETTTLSGQILGSVKVIPKLKEQAAYALKTQLSIDGQAVELETGLRVKHPILVETIPSTLWCRPDTQFSAAIAIKSNLTSSAQGKLYITAPKELAINQNEIEISLAPESYTGVNLEVKVNSKTNTQIFPIKVRTELQVENSTLTTRTETINLHCLDTGGILVSSFDENRRLQIHTETMHFEINLSKGAHIDRLHNKITGHQHIRSTFRESLGPPYWPSEQLRTPFQFRIEDIGPGIQRIITWMDSEKFQALRFIKTFTLTADSPILRVDYGFQNSSSTLTHEIQIALFTFPSTGYHLHVLPLVDGILREEAIEDEFFADGLEIPRKRKDWAETWYCAEAPHLGEITAILFPPTIFHDLEGGRMFPSFQLKAPPIPPESEITLPPIYVVTGTGTWQHVRQLWYNRFYSHKSRFLPEIQTNPAVDLQLTSSPILHQAKKETNLMVTLRHSVLRPIKGKVRFSTPTGFIIKPKTQSFKKLDRKTPIQIPLQLLTPNNEQLKAQVIPIQAEVQLPIRTHQFELPVIFSRTSGTVEVTKSQEADQEILLIDNGKYLCKLAPRFSGTWYALIEKDSSIDFLASSFPKAGSKVWFNPWYGGVRIDPYPYGESDWELTHLDEERWTGRPIHRTDWKGAAFKVRPGKKARTLQGLQFELQILTQPQSNIFALISRYKNLSDATRQVRHRIHISLPPKGSTTGLETVVPRGTGTHYRRRVETHGWPTSTKPYFGVKHAKGNHSICFVAPFSREGTNYLGDMPPELIQLTNIDSILLRPKKTIEHFCYLVIIKGPWKIARHYATLQNYQF